jgi:hypothetical protein
MTFGYVLWLRSALTESFPLASSKLADGGCWEAAIFGTRKLT